MCNCAIVAGDGITVSGNGSTDAPYTISADSGELTVADTATVDHTLTGSGSVTDPYVLTSDVRVSTATPDNLLTAQPDGLAVTCEDVQDCVGEAMAAGQGLAYDDDANAMSAAISADTGNVIGYGSDGGLYAMGAGQLISTGCGVIGDGTPGSPVEVAPAPWTFGCAPEQAGEPLACGADGLLYGAPPQRVWTPVFSGGDLDFVTPGDSLIDGFDRGFQIVLTNPDPCRTMRGLILIDATVRTNLQPATEVVARIDGDIHHRYRNDGPSLAQVYHRMHTNRPIAIPPGGTQTIRWDVETGLVSGGGTVARATCIVRVMGVSQ